jgi:hypothetical protein
MHSFSHIPGSSSFGTPSHTQQSDCSLQSASTSHSGSLDPPVVVDPSVVIGSLVIGSLVAGSVVTGSLVIGSLVDVVVVVVIIGPLVGSAVVASLPTPVSVTPGPDDPVELDPGGSPVDPSSAPPPGLHARRMREQPKARVMRMAHAYHEPRPVHHAGRMFLVRDDPFAELAELVELAIHEQTITVVGRLALP